MKILVLSDSHGNIQNMIRAVDMVSPRMLIHLGDCWRDGEKLRALFPRTPMEQVPGNCDYQPSQPPEKLLLIEEQRVLICHGHTYGVKQSLLRAGCAAQEQQSALFLFGHTHRPLCEQRGPTLFLNPGSIGDYAHPSYAVVHLDGGQVCGNLFQLT